MVDRDDIHTCEYLAAATRCHRLRVSLIVRLRSVIALDLDLHLSVFSDERGYEHPVPVRVDAACIFTVHLNYHFGSCMMIKPEFLASHLFRNGDFTFDECCSIRGEIHIAVYKRSPSFGIILEFIFAYLTCIADSEILNLIFLLDDASS